MQMPASSGHIRRTSSNIPPPTAACQILVISDGTTGIAAAWIGLISSPSKPIDTVGKPMPITPLTKPASRKAPAVAARIAAESTRASFAYGGLTLRDGAPLHNAHHPNSGFRFRESRFVAASYGSMPYFSTIRWSGAGLNA
jgi:hypothetical protein